MLGLFLQEELIDAIQQAAAKTASSFQELAADVEQQADSAATPLRRRQSARQAHKEQLALLHATSCLMCMKEALIAACKSGWRM